jgi:hypothetical protein
MPVVIGVPIYSEERVEINGTWMGHYLKERLRSK